MNRSLALGWICIFGALTALDAVAQENVYLPLNVSRLRSLSLGSSTAGLLDDMSATVTNPAAYSLYSEKRDFRVTFFLSPFAPFVIANRPEGFFNQSVSDAKERVAEFLALFKGVNVTLRGFDFGVQLFEPAFSDSSFLPGMNKLHLNSVYNNHFNTFTMRLRLAQQVSIGASLHLSYLENEDGKRDSGLGASYGVLLKPSDYLNVGVSLFIAPDKMRHYRSKIEELNSESLNIGVTYFAPLGARILFGLQNISVGQDTLHEIISTGLEKVFFSQIAVRGGARYASENKSFMYSAGVGLLNLNSIWGPRRKFRHENFFLNYAIIRKEMLDKVFYIHGFNAQFRF